MAKLTFRGAELRYDDMRREETATFHRLHFSSVLTAAIAEEMGWDVLDEGGTLRSGIGNCPLTGERKISDFKLDPNGLKQHALELPAESIGDFRVKVSGDDEERPLEVKLNFTVVTNAKAGRLIQDYMDTVGQGSAVLQCTMLGEAQTELPGLEKHKRRGKAADADPDDAAPAGPAVASSREMSGVQ